jgi:hypothetical protein
MLYYYNRNELIRALFAIILGIDIIKLAKRTAVSTKIWKWDLVQYDGAVGYQKMQNTMSKPLIGEI